jgi:hypothetical protein
VCVCVWGGVYKMKYVKSMYAFKINFRVSTNLEPQLDKILLGKHLYDSSYWESYVGPHCARILQTLKLLIIFLNDIHSIELIWVAFHKFVIVILMFKMFLPLIQTEFTKFTRIYDHFKDEVCLLYIYELHVW